MKACLVVLVGWALSTPLVGVSAEEHGPKPESAACAGPSTKSYLKCARGCEKDFYFTEHTDPGFASLRIACIDGCAEVPDDNVSIYQGCYRECQQAFRYRHGIRGEFADFQAACIRGCRKAN